MMLHLGCPWATGVPLCNLGLATEIPAGTASLQLTAAWIPGAAVAIPTK